MDIDRVQGWGKQDPRNTKWLSSQAEGILMEIIQKVRLSKHTCITLSSLCNYIHGQKDC